MKLIALTQGKSAIVDDEDFERLSQYRWHSSHGRYAARQARMKEGKRQRIWMHREVLPCPVGFEPDHINGNGLDNRRANLRVATHQQNQQNQRTKNSFGVKGVYHVSHSVRRRFGARITVDGKDIYLGVFETAAEAGEAYRQSAIKHFREFACV